MESILADCYTSCNGMLKNENKSPVSVFVLNEFQSLTLEWMGIAGDSGGQRGPPRSALSTRCFLLAFPVSIGSLCWPGTDRAVVRASLTQIQN